VDPTISSINEASRQELQIPIVIIKIDKEFLKIHVPFDFQGVPLPIGYFAIAPKKTKVTMNRIQYNMLCLPLVVAKCISIHKSQGLTKNEIVLYLGLIFQLGLIYVAISRVKDILNLYIVSSKEDFKLLKMEDVNKYHSSLTHIHQHYKILRETKLLVSIRIALISKFPNPEDPFNVFKRISLDSQCTRMKSLADEETRLNLFNEKNIIHNKSLQDIFQNQVLIDKYCHLALPGSYLKNPGLLKSILMDNKNVSRKFPTSIIKSRVSRSKEKPKAAVQHSSTNFSRHELSNRQHHQQQQLSSSSALSSKHNKNSKSMFTVNDIINRFYQDKVSRPSNIAPLFYFDLQSKGVFNNYHGTTCWFNVFFQMLSCNKVIIKYLIEINNFNVIPDACPLFKNLLRLILVAHLNCSNEDLYNDILKVDTSIFLNLYASMINPTIIDNSKVNFNIYQDGSEQLLRIKMLILEEFNYSNITGYDNFYGMYRIIIDEFTTCQDCKKSRVTTSLNYELELTFTSSECNNCNNIQGLLELHTLSRNFTPDNNCNLTVNCQRHGDDGRLMTRKYNYKESSLYLIIRPNSTDYFKNYVIDVTIFLPNTNEEYMIDNVIFYNKVHYIFFRYFSGNSSYWIEYNDSSVSQRISNLFQYLKEKYSSGTYYINQLCYVNTKDNVSFYFTGPLDVNNESSSSFQKSEVIDADISPLVDEDCNDVIFIQESKEDIADLISGSKNYYRDNGNNVTLNHMFKGIPSHDEILYNSIFMQCNEFIQNITNNNDMSEASFPCEISLDNEIISLHDLASLICHQQSISQGIINLYLNLFKDHKKIEVYNLGIIVDFQLDCFTLPEEALLETDAIFILQSKATSIYYLIFVDFDLSTITIYNPLYNNDEFDGTLTKYPIKDIIYDAIVDKLALEEKYSLSSWEPIYYSLFQFPCQHVNDTGIFILQLVFNLCNNLLPTLVTNKHITYFRKQIYWYIFINKNLNYIEEVPPVNDIDIDIDMDSTNQQVHQLLELSSDELCNMTQSLISYRFLPLEQHDTNLVENILSGPANDDVIIYKFATLMTRAKLKCLHDEEWLNDEVINFYMLLLKDCSDSYYYKDPDIRLKSHYFSSYFMTRLLYRNKYDYNQVKRWSKKFDIFSLEKIFFPININNTHWILIVVRMLEKMISLYDSLNNVYPMHTDAVMKWIVDEGRVKKGVIVNKCEWTIVSKPIPQAPRRK